MSDASRASVRSAAGMRIHSLVHAKCGCSSVGASSCSFSRDGSGEKVPVVCVVGVRDMESGVLSVRTRADGELGELVVDEVVDRLASAVESKGAF